MALAGFYKTRAQLKRSIGKPLDFMEVSMFGAEYKENGTVSVEGPHPVHTWWAQVTMRDGIIERVK